MLCPAPLKGRRGFTPVGVLGRVGVRLFGEALVHNVHYMTACVAPAAGCAKRTYNAHYVK